MRPSFSLHPVCRLPFPALREGEGGGDRIGERDDGPGEGWKGRLRDDWFLEGLGVWMASSAADTGMEEEWEWEGGVRSWEIMWGFLSVGEYSCAGCLSGM